MERDVNNISKDIKAVYKILISILAVIGVFFCCLNKAFAEEIITPQDVYDKYTINHTQYTDSLFNEIMNNCEYWSVWANNDYSDITVIWTPDPYFNGFFINMSSSAQKNEFNYEIQPFANNYSYPSIRASMHTLYAGSMDFVSNSPNTVYWDKVVYSMHVTLNYIDFYKFWADRSDRYGWQTSSYQSGVYCVANVTRNRQNYNNNDGTWRSHTSGRYTDSTDYLRFSTANYDGIMGVSISSNRYMIDIKQNYIPITNNTDGLSVYKQSIHNNDFLLIDFSRCINWSLASNSDYYLGESSFTLDVDGVQHTIELDDETYYTYNSNTKKAYFQIPVSFFNAYGYETAVNVFVTDVNINYGIVVGMPMNFEAHYIDNVWLKRVANIDFEPSEYQQEAEIVYQDNVSYVENHKDYIAYNDTSFNMEYTIDQPLYTTIEGAKASINGTAKTFTIQAWYDSEDTNKVYFMPLETTTSDRVELWDFLIDNPYALYCDVLIVEIRRYTLPVSYDSNTPWEYTHTVGYMVIYTQRYYLRNMSTGVLTSLVDITNYEKNTAQYTYWLYDLADDKLRNMDTNMAAYFTSDLEILNDILTKLDSINNIVPNLQDILNNILDALRNLDLDMPITDLTGITAQLDTIIARLDTIASNTTNSNMNNDWYRRYRNWLYDTNEDSIINTPHEYALTVFDDITALFDVFAYFDDTQSDGFWTSAREYLNRMNGGEYNDNINDYIVKGIASPNFNINNNTVYGGEVE